MTHSIKHLFHINAKRSDVKKPSPLLNQITLILKALCGFSTTEIAKAFLTSEDTISKRL
ncbi:MAG TPA: hypothetical protein VJ111_08545 [Chitinophagaceae bacterium]|nr:hypothetical protein [Chitinophagaceae bacterium]